MTYDYCTILDDAARRTPEKIGLISQDTTFTYAEIAAAVDRLTAALAGQGIRQGDRVVLCLGNEPEWVFSFFALARLRATLVLVSTAWQQQEFENAFALTQPVGVIAAAGKADLVDQLGRPRFAAVHGESAREGWLDLAELVATPFEGGGLRPEPADPAELELAFPFSSGTTGVPKAVRHTHRSLYTATKQWNETLGLGEDDRLQALTPLAHILGIVNIGATFMSSATITLFQKFSPTIMMDSLEQDRITIGMTVAPIAAAIATMPGLEERDLSALRYLNWSATPVNPAIAADVTARTGIPWLPAYGTTEVPVVAVSPVSSLPHGRLDSVGLPPDGVDVEAIDVETLAFLPRGETGEIVVRSPAAMNGYLPEGGSSPFLDGGWYRTGDIGIVEPEGWVHVNDRKKDLIRVSGNQASPVEIENVLMRSPFVKDCAVFGVSDERRGEIPCAAVIPEPGWEPDEQTLIEWLAPQLAAYKRLRSVYFVDEIPRTPSGKVQRRKLVPLAG
ncbi:MAG: class I adenylate-forming enzyme family protein [Microbacterium sp.]